MVSVLQKTLLTVFIAIHIPFQTTGMEISLHFVVNYFSLIFPLYVHLIAITAKGYRELRRFGALESNITRSNGCGRIEIDDEMEDDG